MSDNRDRILVYRSTPEKVTGILEKFIAAANPVLSDENVADVYQPIGPWICIDTGPDWSFRSKREVAEFLSRRLETVALYCFVDDIGCWGYDLWRNGNNLDRFVKDPNQGPILFPDEKAEGNAVVLASCIEHLTPENAKQCLTQLAPHETIITDTGFDPLGVFEKSGAFGFLNRIGLRFKFLGGHMNLDADIFKFL